MLLAFDAPAEGSALVDQDPVRAGARGDRLDILSILVEHYVRLNDFMLFACRSGSGN
ncbi:hypothetical protein [Burkholderia sp. Ac-20365]|uniref:hypothetical protein n=1 Tax=Burkholderia sp. Ac-20365 TaxID=2703897 RepID=UPI00197C5962|nr:hypothetical protein [Burkholderia sp. Ac-20365]MBN3761123.1 hypothetical protein [Burkholderia sp. Ac-20365]